MSAVSKTGQIQLSPTRKVLFLLVSLAALAASLYLIDLETKTVIYSVVLAIALFAFMQRLHGRAPSRSFWPEAASQVISYREAVTEPGQTIGRKMNERPLCTWKQPLKDTQLPNRIFKLRILVFVIVMLVLVPLAYFYGASPL